MENGKQLTIFDYLNELEPIAKKHVISNAEQIPDKEATSIIDSLQFKYCTKEDIIKVFKQGSMIQDSKYRIQLFFEMNTSLKDRVTFLKEEYGCGGRSYNFLNDLRGFVNFNSKGICLSIYDLKEDYLISYNMAAKIIAELITNDNYLRDKEKDTYEKLKNIYNTVEQIPNINPCCKIAPLDIPDVLNISKYNLLGNKNIAQIVGINVLDLADWNHIKELKSCKYAQIFYNNNLYKFIDSWKNFEVGDGESYYSIGETSNGMFIALIVDFASEKTTICGEERLVISVKDSFEYDKRPTKEKVQDDYIDKIAHQSLDKYEAEYGADGYKVFPHLNDGTNIFFTVAQCSEFHELGHYKDDISDLSEAIKKLSYYKQISPQMCPAIGILVETQKGKDIDVTQWDITGGKFIDLDTLKRIPAIYENEKAMKKIKEIADAFPDVTIIGEFPFNDLEEKQGISNILNGR